MPNEDNTTVGLEPEDAHAERSARFRNLQACIRAFEALGKSKSYTEWQRVEEAYREFRDFDRPARPLPSGDLSSKDDQAMIAWRKKDKVWKEAMFGNKAKPHVRDLLSTYNKLQGHWHKHSDRYRQWNASYMAAYRARKKEEANAPTCPGVNGKSCFAGVVKLTKLKNGKGYRKLCDSCLKVQRAGYGKELAS